MHPVLGIVLIAGVSFGTVWAVKKLAEVMKS